MMRISGRIGLVFLACAGIGGSRLPAAVIHTVSIYSLTGGADGAWPNAAPLIDGVTGVLYATSFAGGSGSSGTVFSLTPPQAGTTAWTQTTLWSFTGGADGASPVGSLIEDNTGALYGTASGGGAGHAGTVFQLSPPAAGQTAWTEATLHDFTLATDGGNPSAGLVAGANGVLYGTTASYGPNGYGTVFRLLPPGAGGTAWTETTLWAFTGGADGGHPLSTLLIDNAGNLYGTASQGGTNALGGTVFEISPAIGGGLPIETTLHSFTGPDGLHPAAALIVDKSGALYGTTAFGGATGQGTVFQLTPPAVGGTDWTQSVLYSFSAAAGGIHPFSPLLADKHGALYGTTFGYVSVAFQTTPPTVFRLTPPPLAGGGWTIGILASLDPKIIGQNVVGGLVSDGQAGLYGPVVIGKPNGKTTFPGGIFEVKGAGFVAP